MGFGYLLIGYVIAFVFSVSNVYFFADVIGGAVMLAGLASLSAHEKNFYRALWADVAYVLVCLARAVAVMLKWIGGEGIASTVFGVAILLCALVLHFFILAGIYHLSTAVGLEKEPRKARRNLAMILAYYPLYIISMILRPYFGETLQSVLALAVTVYGVLVILMNVWLLYCAYCSICLSGQEKGEGKRSKHEWLNKINDKIDSVMDGAFQPSRAKLPKEAEEVEPGYRRVKRKKHKGHK